VVDDGLGWRARLPMITGECIDPTTRASTVDILCWEGGGYFDDPFDSRNSAGHNIVMLGWQLSKGVF
jgi:hypothetical protein